MSAVTFVHAALTVSGLTSRYTRKQNAPDNSEDVKPKYYVIVAACAEAFLSLVLTFTHFIIMLIILMEPIIMYWMDLHPHQGNQLNLKGFLFNLWDGILIPLANEN